MASLQKKIVGLKRGLVDVEDVVAKACYESKRLRRLSDTLEICSKVVRYRHDVKVSTLT